LEPSDGRNRDHPDPFAVEEFAAPPINSYRYSAIKNHKPMARGFAALGYASVQYVLDLGFEYPGRNPICR
jgi:hypothetical protein